MEMLLECYDQFMYDLPFMAFFFNKYFENKYCICLPFH